MTPEEYLRQVGLCLHRLTPEEKAAAQEELRAHIEDHAEALEALGYGPELARQRTMAAMGDPQEVGRALEKQYPPFWLYLGRAAGVATALLVLVMVLGLGMLSIPFHNIQARLIPSASVFAQESGADLITLDQRIAIGDDILRLYGVYRRTEEGRQLVVVEGCLYDRFPGGFAADGVVRGLRLASQRNETAYEWDFGPACSGNVGAWYFELEAPVEVGDTYVVLSYEGFGRRVEAEIPLPEVTP